MTRGVRLGNAEGLHNLVDILFAVEESLEDGETGGVSETAEELGFELDGISVIEHRVYLDQRFE